MRPKEEEQLKKLFSKWLKENSLPIIIMSGFLGYMVYTLRSIFSLLLLASIYGIMILLGYLAEKFKDTMIVVAFIGLTVFLLIRGVYYKEWAGFWGLVLFLGAMFILYLVCWLSYRRYKKTLKKRSNNKEKPES